MRASMHGSLRALARLALTVLALVCMAYAATSGRTSAQIAETGAAAQPVPDGPARKPEPATVEGVLWYREAATPVPELAAGKEVVVAQPRAALTGFLVFVQGFSVTDVYLPNDALKKQARELNGQRVKITGEVRYVVVVNKWFGQEKLGRNVPAPHGQSIWVPTSLDDLPKRRAVVWATDLKPFGPKAAPWVGEPVVKRPGEQFVTFKRLPKSSEVTAVKLSDYPNADLPGLKRLTLASFVPLLDGLTPIRADDEGVKLDSRAPWYDCEFETAEAEFYLRLYLCGSAMLGTPDGKTGWVRFQHPK